MSIKRARAKYERQCNDQNIGRTHGQTGASVHPTTVAQKYEHCGPGGGIDDGGDADHGEAVLDQELHDIQKQCDDGGAGGVGGDGHGVADMKAVGPRRLWPAHVPAQVVTDGDGGPTGSSYRRDYIQFRQYRAVVLQPICSVQSCSAPRRLRQASRVYD